MSARHSRHWLAEVPRAIDVRPRCARSLVQQFAPLPPLLAAIRRSSTPDAMWSRPCSIHLRCTTTRVQATPVAPHYVCRSSFEWRGSHRLRADPPRRCVQSRHRSHRRPTWKSCLQPEFRPLFSRESRAQWPQVLGQNLPRTAAKAVPIQRRNFYRFGSLHQGTRLPSLMAWLDRVDPSFHRRSLFDV